MFEAFIPDYYFHQLTDIDVFRLRHHGIRMLIVDYDNTLVEPHSRIIPKESADFIDTCKKAGIQPVILSNNFSFRSADFAKAHGCAVYTFSLKPLKRGYQKALQDYQLKPSQCAAVGDQLLTDILGARRMGMMTILVDPRSEKDNIFGRFNRIAERIIYKKSEENGILVKGKYYGKL